MEEKFRQGDEPEKIFYEEIFVALKDKIYHYLYRKLRTIEPDPSATSEELTGNILIKARRQIGKRTAFSEAWLYKVADNEVENYRRYITAGSRDIRKTESFEELTANRAGKTVTSGAGMGDTRGNPEEDILKKELADQIDKRLRQLSALQRNAFTLHDIKGFNYTAIALILNTTSENAKDAAHRARLALKGHLEKYLGERRTNIR